MTKRELIALMAAIIRAGDLMATELARQSFDLRPHAGKGNEPEYPSYFTPEQCVEEAEALYTATMKAAPARVTK